jgi:hypothetical protein
MSKLGKFFAVAALVVGALAMTPGPAAARWGHGWGHGWHHGWGWGGPGPFWAWGYGYPYYGSPYYAAAPGCGYVRVWRNHHWVLRRDWRCY